MIQRMEIIVTIQIFNILLYYVPILLQTLFTIYT